MSKLIGWGWKIKLLFQPKCLLFWVAIGPRENVRSLLVICCEQYWTWRLFCLMIFFHKWKWYMKFLVSVLHIHSGFFFSCFVGCTFYKGLNELQFNRNVYNLIFYTCNKRDFDPIVSWSNRYSHFYSLSLSSSLDKHTFVEIILSSLWDLGSSKN